MTLLTPPISVFLWVTISPCFSRGEKALGHVLKMGVHLVLHIKVTCWEMPMLMQLSRTLTSREAISAPEDKQEPPRQMAGRFDYCTPGWRLAFLTPQLYAVYAAASAPAR